MPFLTQIYGQMWSCWVFENGIHFFHSLVTVWCHFWLKSMAKYGFIAFSKTESTFFIHLWPQNAIFDSNLWLNMVSLRFRKRNPLSSFTCDCIMPFLTQIYGQIWFHCVFESGIHFLLSLVTVWCCLIVVFFLLNSRFMCINIAAAADAFLVMGCAAYAPKIIQSQFGYSASTASVIVGAATIPMGAGGTFLGGYFVKRLKLECGGILKFCVICSGIALASIFVFLVKCPDQRFAGVQTPYAGSSELLTENLRSTCNADCGCPVNRFDPVCGLAGNTMFLTPCHAGCSAGTEGDAALDFFNCSCIGVSAGNGSAPVAKRMACSTDCGSLNYVFIVVFAILILFTFLSSKSGAVLFGVNNLFHFPFLINDFQN